MDSQCRAWRLHLRRSPRRSAVPSVEIHQQAGSVSVLGMMGLSSYQQSRVKHNSAFSQFVLSSRSGQFMACGVIPMACGEIPVHVKGIDARDQRDSYWPAILFSALKSLVRTLHSTSSVRWCDQQPLSKEYWSLGGYIRPTRPNRSDDAQALWRSDTTTKPQL